MKFDGLKIVDVDLEQKDEIAIYVNILLEDAEGNKFKMRAASFLFDLKAIDAEIP